MRALLIAAALIVTPAAGQTGDPQTRTEADGSRTLVVETLVPAAPAAVWQAISTAEGWKRWAAPSAWLVAPDLLETSYNPAARAGDPANIRQRLVATLPGRLLVFRTVQTPPGFPHAAAFMGVTQFLELIPEGSVTRVRLTGANYPAGAEGDALLGFFTTGNRTTLDRLAAALALAPLDFLTGHCWAAELKPGKTDTHCFTRTPEGKIKDRHDVVAGGKTVYWGETLYRPAGGAIRFAYANAAGPVAEGVVKAIPEGLDFGTSDYKGADGKPISITTRWVRVGTDTFDAVDVAPTAPAFNRTVRYSRVAVTE